MATLSHPALSGNRKSGNRTTCRFEVSSGVLGLLETFPKREEALRHAEWYAGTQEPPDEVQVYDVMARVGMTTIWAYRGGKMVPIGQRKT